MALCLRWKYFPTYHQLTLYRKIFSKYYPAELVKIYDDALRMNCDSSLLLGMEDIRHDSKVVIYGAGEVSSGEACAAGEGICEYGAV